MYSLTRNLWQIFQEREGHTDGRTETKNMCKKTELGKKAGHKERKNGEKEEQKGSRVRCEKGRIKENEDTKK